MQQFYILMLFQIMFTLKAGIADSLFLVQGQLTKTESYGVYNQMLMKVCCHLTNTTYVSRI